MSAVPVALDRAEVEALVEGSHKMAISAPCERIPHAPHGFKDESEVKSMSKGYRRLLSFKSHEAAVEDAAGYHGELITGPDFGCILYEAKT